MTDISAIPRSPSAELLGWRLLAQDSAKGWVRIGFDGKRDFLNPAGKIQGGILAAMLDDCMGPAAWVMTNGERYTATIDMNVSFLGPVEPGSIVGEGQVVRLGNTIAFLEARLFGADERLLARATSSARLVDSGAVVSKFPKR